MMYFQFQCKNFFFDTKHFVIVKFKNNELCLCLRRLFLYHNYVLHVCSNFHDTTTTKRNASSFPFKFKPTSVHQKCVTKYRNKLLCLREVEKTKFLFPFIVCDFSFYEFPFQFRLDSNRQFSTATHKTKKEDFKHLKSCTRFHLQMF